MINGDESIAAASASMVIERKNKEQRGEQMLLVNEI